jgi:hypothetical protein
MAAGLPSIGNLSTRGFKGFALLGLALTLGACQLVSAPKSPEVVKAAPAKPAPKAKKKVVEVARIAPEPERVYPDPASLKGTSARNVVDTIGKPGFIRKDQPAEIWQYRGATCTLDVFLYQSVTGAPYKVDYIETRSDDEGPTSNKECLVSILKEREAAKTAVPTS